jgi:hypothetical protein
MALLTKLSTPLDEILIIKITLQETLLIDSLVLAPLGSQL